MRNSDQVEIPMEANDSSRKGPGFERVEKLLKMRFGSSDNHMQFGVFKDSMRFEIYNAVRDVEEDVNKFLDVLEKVCRKHQIDCQTILHQTTSTGDSLLHFAAEFGREEIAKLLVDLNILLDSRNKNRQTPLHVAAKAKNIGVMKVILSKFEDATKDDFIMSQDTLGNTALHEAILSKHPDGVRFLLREQSKRSLSRYWDTLPAKSPMHLAVQVGDAEILDDLLQIPLPCHQLISGYQEISPLFATILERNSALVQKIVDKRPDIMDLADENHNNPLHYAAHIGYVEGIRIMLQKSTLFALRPNSNNDFPIHVACKGGHVQVVKELLDVGWSSDRYWLNNQGRNILHIAAMCGQNNVVKYLLENPKIHWDTVNERDQNGDTSLHLASKKLHLWTLRLLSRDEKIDVNLINNEGLTARDVVWKLRKIPNTRQEFLADVILESASVPLKKSMLEVQRVPLTNREWDVKKAANTILRAMLIFTVSYAAGFTVCAHRDPYMGFMLFDLLTMVSSLLGYFILEWVLMGDRTRPFAKTAHALANIFIYLALALMAPASVFGIRLVVGNNIYLADSITAFGIWVVLLILFSQHRITSQLAIRVPIFREVNRLFIWIILFCRCGSRDNSWIGEEDEIRSKPADKADKVNSVDPATKEKEN